MSTPGGEGIWSVLVGDIVREFVSSEGLRRHMLGVEACLVAYADKYGQDRDQWAVTALLHDFGIPAAKEIGFHGVK